MTAAIVVTAALAGCASAKPEPREHTNRFDLDGDGFLTQEEYSASALSGVMDFDSLDTDGDGLLSRRELEFRAGGRSRSRRPQGGNRCCGDADIPGMHEILGISHIKQGLTESDEPLSILAR